MKLGLWSSPEDAFLEFVYANESVSHRKILLLNCTLMESSVCGKINLHTIAAQKYITPQAA